VVFHVPIDSYELSLVSRFSFSQPQGQLSAPRHNRHSYQRQRSDRSSRPPSYGICKRIPEISSESFERSETNLLKFTSSSFSSFSSAFPGAESRPNVLANQRGDSSCSGSRFNRFLRIESRFSFVVFRFYSANPKANSAPHSASDTLTNGKGQTDLLAHVLMGDLGATRSIFLFSRLVFCQPSPEPSPQPTMAPFPRPSVPPSEVPTIKVIFHFYSSCVDLSGPTSNFQIWCYHFSFGASFCRSPLCFQALRFVFHDLQIRALKN
jgi:hypothetical protein